MVPTAEEAGLPAEAATPAGAAGAPAPARPGGVIGVAVGLVLVALCVLAFFRPHGGPADGAALLGAWFDRTGELPFELAVERGARLAGGVEAVVLARPDAAPLEPEALEEATEPEAPQPEASPPEASRPEAAEPGAEGAAPPPPKVDWAEIRPAAEGTPPERVVVVRYPLGRAEDVYAAQFQRLAWRRIDDIEPQGGRAVVDSGQLEWGELSARYVVERRWVPKPEPAFHDLLRVSLTTRERFCVLYALWPRDEVASTEPVEALLAVLRPAAP